MSNIMVELGRGVSFRHRAAVGGVAMVPSELQCTISIAIMPISGTDIL